MIWFILIGIIVFIFIIFALRNVDVYSELRKVNENRPELSKDDYAYLLIQKGFKKEHIEIVYDAIKKHTFIDKLSIYPEDDIYNLLCIDSEDFADIIVGIFKGLNKRIPEHEEIEKLNHEFESKMTVEYILKLLEI